MKPHRLPVRPAWRQGESFAGYVLRLHAVNAQPVNEGIVSALRVIHAATDTPAATTLVGRLLEALGIEGYQSALAGWLAFRRDSSSDRLISLCYRPDWHCPACIADFGFRPALWDLRGFDRCIQHAVWLVSKRNVGGNANRPFCDVRSQAKSQVVKALTASAVMWLPEHFPKTGRAAISVEDGPAAVYARIAALAFLLQEIHRRRRRIKPIDSMAYAITVAEQHYLDVRDWLSVEPGKLATLLCHEAGITHVPGSSNQWGWSPVLLRVHQVAGWLAQNKVLAAAHEMLEGLRQIAVEHCLQVDRFVDGHGHAALPALDSLAIVAPPGCFRRHDDIVGYLQLFARLHGIPALGYGQAGIVVRRHDADALVGQVSELGTGATEIYTADRPLWTLN